MRVNQGEFEWVLTSWPPAVEIVRIVQMMAVPGAMLSVKHDSWPSRHRLSVASSPERFVCTSYLKMV